VVRVGDGSGDWWWEDGWKREREGEEAYIWEVRGSLQTVTGCGAFEYLRERSFGTSK
jgi:hypothetical protein